MLWVRSLDALTAQALPGTDRAARSFWSPDSRSIAFFADRKLKKIDATGGPTQNLCDAMTPRGGTWNRDGVILFSANEQLYRVASAGGEPVAVTKLTEGQTSHRIPAFLPDGQHFLYIVSGLPEVTGVYVGALDSSESKRVLNADSGAIYSPSGDLLFLRQGILLRQAFDLKKLALKGDPAPVAEQLPGAGNHGPFSVSDNGVLAYRNGVGNQDAQLSWLDRSGKLIETVGLPGAYRGLDLSPDGKRIAVHRHDGTGGDIWVFESSRGPMPRFTFDASQDNSNPVWSPDGSRFVFESRRNGKWGLYQKLANGTVGEDLLYESAFLTIPIDPKTSGDQWILPLTGEKKPIPVIQSQYNEDFSQVSPDEKWIAYRSNETGQSEAVGACRTVQDRKRQYPPHRSHTRAGSVRHEFALEYLGRRNVGSGQRCEVERAVIQLHPSSRGGVARSAGVVAYTST